MQLDLLNAPAAATASDSSIRTHTPVLSAGYAASDVTGTVPESAADRQIADKKKSPDAFKNITEVATLLGVQQYVLRFWESKFAQIKPVKMRGGRRYYRPEDIELLLKIKNLLYKQGYTIKGAKKALSSKANIAEPRPQPAKKKSSAALSDKQVSQLAVIRQELIGMQDVLKPYVF